MLIYVNNQAKPFDIDDIELNSKVEKAKGLSDEQKQKAFAAIANFTELYINTNNQACTALRQNKESTAKTVEIDNEIRDFLERFSEKNSVIQAVVNNILPDVGSGEQQVENEKPEERRLSRKLSIRSLKVQFQGLINRNKEEEKEVKSPSKLSSFLRRTKSSAKLITPKNGATQKEVETPLDTIRRSYSAPQIISLQKKQRKLQEKYDNKGEEFEFLQKMIDHLDDPTVFNNALLMTQNYKLDKYKKEDGKFDSKRFDSIEKLSENFKKSFYVNRFSISEDKKEEIEQVKNDLIKMKNNISSEMSLLMKELEELNIKTNN